MYRIREYANTLRLIYKKMPGVSSVALGVWINVGSRHEEEHICGISHFLEHLVFKGSKNYSGDEIKESVEGVGGSLNAFTSEENTCYYAKFPARCAGRIFNVLSDMVLYPRLRASDIEKERTVIIEEIKMYKDLPQFQVQEIFDALLWPNHPLGRSIAGTIESVSGITRRNLQDYHSRWYGPAGIVVACAGDVDEKMLERFVLAAFSKLRSVPAAGVLPFSLRKEGVPKIRVAAKDIEQTHLNLGFLGLCRSHHDRFALGLIHVILGGNMSSRLFNEIREKKGLAYEIATHVKKLRDTGAFFVHAGIDNKKLSEASLLIFQVLDRMKKERVGKGELRRAKDFYLGQSEMALDETMEHMLWMGESLANLGYMETKEEVRRHIERVTAEDLRRVAAEFFDWRELRFAAVGPPGLPAEGEIQGLVERVDSP